MDILFLSHCVPYPPDKGERIRAFHEIRHLAREHRVHLACLARSEREMSDAEALRDCCASVNAVPLRPAWALARAAVHFAAGACLTTAFYGSRALARRVSALARTTPLDAAVIYSAAMAPYCPPGLPAILDLVDVDSEKYLAYAKMRRAGPLYRIEGHRLRRLERIFAARAACSFLATPHEVQLFAQFAPGERALPMENGVDFAFFDPAAPTADRALASRRYLVFVGVMDYFPNADAAVWFADRVLPGLRDVDPALEFLIVGRDPAPAVRALAARPGIQVTGAVPDVRPYLQGALAAVAPLRIARGLQNKVLEALAMGLPVMASRAVCQTLDPLPAGVVPCDSEPDYLRAFRAGAQVPPAAIRAAAERRFSWDRNMQALSNELCRVYEQNRLQPTRERSWAPTGS
jgi:sugar transferase (PEP-CTERM/EpsH1 system associated)